MRPAASENPFDVAIGIPAELESERPDEDIAHGRHQFHLVAPEFQDHGIIAPMSTGDHKRDFKLAALLYFVFAGALATLLGRNAGLGLRFEDALIALRYARNLVAGHGFVFNPGEYVLGVTTPLHTLMSTLYVALGGEQAPVLQNLAGIVFLVAEGFLVLLLARRLASTQGPPYAAFLVSLLVLGNFNLNYLYIGMEVHLFAFLVLLAFHLFLEEKETACGVVLGLAFLTRYDAALMAGLIGMFLLLRGRRFPWRLTLAFAVVVAPWLVFAQFYFGSILPNPLSAKEGNSGTLIYLHRVFFEYKAAFKNAVGLYTSTEFLRAGLSYLYLVPVLAGAIMAGLRDRRWVLLGLYPFLHVLTYAVIGSDPGFTWHYYVLNPTFYLFFVVGVFGIVGAVMSPFRDRLETNFSRVLRYSPAVLVAIVLLPLAVHLIRGASHPFKMDPHTRQLHEIGGWLRESYNPETTLLQPAIGVLGYESGLRMIDHAGLVTPGLYFFDDMHCTPMDEVLSRFDPDLILLSDASQVDVTAHGYRLIREFEGSLLYFLYERGVPRP